jgi:hypothetical protein
MGIHGILQQARKVRHVQPLLQNGICELCLSPNGSLEMGDFQDFQ